MKKYIIFLFLFLPFMSLAQDQILLTTGDEIKAKVLEIGLEEVKYKKWDNQNGPAYSLKKTDIFLIKYENGSKDVFSKPRSDSNSNSESKTQAQASGPSSGTPATLYFYRPKKFAGSGPEIIVGTVVPDEVIVKVHNGQWYKTQYSHFGEREFVTGVFAINPEHYKYQIDPGKTYYIRCTLYSQGMKQMAQLELMSEEMAKADMKELKEQKGPK